MLSETQIANKALQHCGASVYIPAGTLWTDNGKNAKEIRTDWDIARRSELRRNVWRFSVRSAVLRPLDTTTKHVVFALYDVATSYVANDIVRDSNGDLWVSKSAQAAPAADPVTRDFTKWDLYYGNNVANSYSALVSYMAGELVYVTTEVYMSLQNSNKGNAVGSATYWLHFATDPALSSTNFIYPIGAGPWSQAQTKNVYKLPTGFLRVAPQDPKAGSYTPLGAPSGLFYSDWNLEGDYFTTTESGAIALRYAADIENPNAFDPMFVDGFACRLAYDCCETITQSTAKLAAIGGSYNKFMSEARMVNGIETGPTEPPEDSYIALRA